MCMFDRTSVAMLEYVKRRYDCDYDCDCDDEEVSKREKLEWLRSNLIGDDFEFESPFGKREITYADCTATGRCLVYVEDYLRRFVLPCYGNTHTSDSYVGQETSKMVAEATEYIKTCLGGGENDAVIFCGSGSTSAIKRLQEVIGIAVSPMLRDRVLKNVIAEEERWVVFVGPNEHHSNYLSWKESLAEVVEIGVDEEGVFDVEDLEKKLRVYQESTRPLMGSFSACSNVTGICLDTRRVARVLHQFGAFACFDFAASGPYVDIKMRSGEIDGYDAIFLSPHKFTGGPGSPGILLMNKAMYKLGSFPPSTCGGGTVNFVNGYCEKDTLYVDDIEERENAGTPPIIQKIRAALAFRVKEYIGHEVIQRQETYFIKTALDRLLPNPKIWILGNTKAKRQAILSFLVYSSPNGDGQQGHYEKRHPKMLNMWEDNGCKRRGKPLHGPFTAKLLNDLFGIQARGGCACAGPYAHYLLNIEHDHSLALRSLVGKGYLGVKPGWARVNFPYYMSNEEFKFIIFALEFIASFGERFLSVYDFNWKTGEWSFSKKDFKEIPLRKNGVNCSTNLARTLKELSLNDYNSVTEDGYADRRRKEASVLEQKQASYLAKATELAYLLPRLPKERNVPEDIDPKLLLYRF